MNKLDVDDYWLWFCNIRGVGRRSRERLLNIFQTPEIVFFCDG